jgi:hypothetical protein
VTFDVLQRRLLDAATHRVRNGEFTERGLARLIGVSQPHLHHVLKGRKSLTSGVGDAILCGLSASLLDLATDQELGQALLERQHSGRPLAYVPVLAGRLGPDDPFPDWRAVSEWLRVPASVAAMMRRPGLVECGTDVENPQFRAGAFALLEQDESARIAPSPEDWFALRWRGAGYVRRVRRTEGALEVLGQCVDNPAPLPVRVELSDASILHVIRGRLLWVGPDPRQADPFGQSGGVYLRARADS